MAASLDVNDGTVRDVVLFGEAMLMLVAAEAGALETVTTFHKHSAGAETNVCIGLARLGFRVGWFSRVGADSMGRYLVDVMRNEGVDCTRVIVAPGERTGLVFKGRASGGSDPVVEYHRKDSAASRLHASDIDESWLLSARQLHVTGVFPALSSGCLSLTRRAIEVMRREKRRISFDPNLRPALWASEHEMRTTLNDLASCCDIVLPGLTEGQLLTGAREPADIARFYRARGASCVIVKLGAGGAYFDDEAEGCGSVPGFPVEAVIDTVGAGDGFAAGVISALLEGRDVRSAARRGAWIGARAVQFVGDMEGLPTRKELQEKYVE